MGNIAQFGSVLEWGSRGLGFKSRYSDHLKERKNGRKTVFLISFVSVEVQISFVLFYLIVVD